jgi:hypothetical protein
MKFPPQMLPGSPADKYPEAPAGTIFVVGPERGYAVPPCRYTLLFGRDREDVHVPVGVDDPAVSRRHGVFTCPGPGSGWWLRNSGNLPIELPDGALLLAGHWRAVNPGYTPLVIKSSRQRSHLVEVRVVGEPRPAPGAILRDPGDPTVPPETVYELSAPERLVLSGLARRYLEGHDDNPLPLTWKETARVANSSPYATRVWNENTVADTVERVRQRLHDLGVYGLVEAEVGQPVGTTLNVNLILELLKTATLGSQDLALLPGDD